VEIGKLLESYKIQYLKEHFCADAAQASSVAAQIGFPVALKVASKKISHKSDVGGVQLNLMGRQEVANAYEIIRRNVGEANMNGVRVQKMAPKGFELIVGGMKDAQFGHLVLFGLGGIYVEIFKDLVFRVCPVDRQMALEMIRSIKSYKMLAGARGAKPINESELADLIVKTSRLLVEQDVQELDFNPVIANEHGCFVVDSRIVEKAAEDKSEY